MAEKYGDKSIKVLTGAERVRLRPASVLGSSGVGGARHGVVEILGNALDEKGAGYGDRIEISLLKDGGIRVRDYGRGVPLGWNDRHNNWNWHIIYNELYGGGKYDNHQEELKTVDWSSFNPMSYNYLYSVGLNGLGAASTQYTSEYFMVKSYRDGVCTSRSFREGVPLVDGEPFDMFSALPDVVRGIKEEKEWTDEANGTEIIWKPDIEVFDSVDIGGDWLEALARDVAGVAGVEIVYRDEISGKGFVIGAGNLVDLVKYRVGDDFFGDVVWSGSDFRHGDSRVEGKDFIWVCECNVALMGSRRGVAPVCFHNLIKMRGGVQYEAFRDGVSAFMLERGKAEGIKFDKKDYDGALTGVVSTFSNYASFRGQTKDAVDDKFIYDIVKATVVTVLQAEYAKGDAVLREVVAEIVARARERIRIEELSKITGKASDVKSKALPSKFVSCRAYEKGNYEDVELWIVEGDSACGSVKQARDSVTQALLPVRGKGLNVSKASLSKIVANQEIQNIFAVLGTGYDLSSGGGKNLFSMDELRVGKVIIATDADDDGYQIRVLIFLVFYFLAPQLLEDGRVYIAETPRFGLTIKGVGRVYARDDYERDSLIREYGDRVQKISRYKGLGEVDADVLRDTTVNEATRRLVKVTCDFEDSQEKEFIDMLFGEDLRGMRKELVQEALEKGYGFEGI